MLERRDGKCCDERGGRAEGAWAATRARACVCGVGDFSKLALQISPFRCTGVVYDLSELYAGRRVDSRPIFCRKDHGVAQP